MPDLLYSSAAVRTAVKPLVELASRLSGTSPEYASSLSERLLALPPDGVGKRGGRSIVTGEGLPLEYSMSVSHKGLRHRLMGDPAAVLADAVERHRHARKVLESMLEATKTTALAGACETLLRIMVRGDAAGLMQYPAGCFWIAVPMEGAGIALFVTADIPGRDPWSCMEQAVTSLLPFPAEPLRLISSLRPFARPASMALEGTSPENARIKIYWRLNAVRPLARMGLPLLTHPAFARFLTLALGERSLGGDGFLADAGFALAGGELVDSKIFLCGHCLAYKPEEWHGLVHELAAQFRLPSIPRLEPGGGGTEISFICFGLDTAQRIRLNLYFKPCFPSKTPS